MRLFRKPKPKAKTGKAYDPANTVQYEDLTEEQLAERDSLLGSPPPLKLETPKKELS
jgi:hypothetical protein